MAYSSAPKPAYSLPCMAMVAIVSFLVIFFADLSAREAFFKVHEDDAANVVPVPVPVPVPGPTHHMHVAAPGITQATRDKFNQKCPGYEESMTKGFSARPAGNMFANCNPCRESQSNKQIVGLKNKPECFKNGTVDVTAAADAAACDRSGQAAYAPGDCVLNGSPDKTNCNGTNFNLDLYTKQTDGSYTHDPKGCVIGNNLNWMSNADTVQSCQTKCDADDKCMAIEFGVAYGGPGKGTKANTDCTASTTVAATVPAVGPQAGAEVTKGYQGQMDVINANLGGDTIAADAVKPIMTRYSEQKGMCPVNVHWHLGTEHLSKGQYDCKDKCGPTPIDHRRLAAGKTQQGYQCNLYDAKDEKFTKKYDWKFCKKMEVGQTYEVHWPHSKLGACGTPNQYQYPFPDGVFCNIQNVEVAKLNTADLASHIGVQAQIFTVVNDESYYYPNLINGMIVGGDQGMDMAVYTGSTTGQSVNNENHCSLYNPITWQVDRKCHLISASTFDKMCADMLGQRDDMTGDVEPHGSRDLVIDALAANNQGDLPTL